MERGDVVGDRANRDVRARRGTSAAEAKDGVDKAVVGRRADEQVVVEVDQPGPGVHRGGDGVLLGAAEQGPARVEGALPYDDDRIARQIGRQGVAGDVELGVGDAELLEAVSYTHLR